MGGDSKGSNGLGVFAHEPEHKPGLISQFEGDTARGFSRGPFNGWTAHKFDLQRGSERHQGRETKNDDGHQG